MGEVIALVLVSLAGGVTVTALLVLLPYLLPRLVDGCARSVATMPGRTLVVGTINAVFFLVVAAVAAQIGNSVSGFVGGVFSLFGLALVWLLLAITLPGLSGLVFMVARRLSSVEGVGDGKPGWPYLVRAAALLVAAALAPVAGWFIFFPLALLMGLGAAILSLIQGLRGPTDSG